MGERRWWPLAWIDEVSPPARPTPDAWLIDACGHYYLGYAFDAEDATDHEKRHFSRSIDGDEPVEFFFQDDLGDFELTVFADGRHEGTPPDGANWFWQSEYDACGDTVAEIARQILDADKMATGASVTVSIYALRQGSQHYRLRLDYSASASKPRPYLESVAAHEAKQ